jgi:hypothetical protein
MASKTYSIQDIAAEFDRLFAGDSQIVDATEIDWGHGTEAGHIGHDHYGHGEDGPPVVGWYCQGGNVGHPVLTIEADDLQRAGETLARLEEAGSLTDIEEALRAAGVRCERVC